MGITHLQTLKPRVATLQQSRAPVQPTQRMTGSGLQRERSRLFAAQPLCVECERQGFVTLATQRDHVVPLADGGADAPENTQALCDACHKVKSAREQRGRYGIAWDGK